MTLNGAGLAHWWATMLTRTAAADIGADRRDEIRSDVFEQVAVARTAGTDESTMSRQIVGRVIRGVPADLVWRVGHEVDPRRVRWHLRNTATVIGVLMIVMVPLNILAEWSSGGVPSLRGLYGPIWGLTFLVGWTQLALVAAAVAARLVPGFLRGVPTLVDLPRRVRARRVVTTVMGASLAASAVCRFSDNDLLSGFSGAGWFMFLVSFAVYLGLVVEACGHRLTLRRYIPKLWT